MPQETAYITGGASGLGRAVATMLAQKHNIRVFIADRDAAGAKAVAQSLNGSHGVLDVTSWADQARIFTQAVSEFGRIDYVYAIAGVGERRWLPQNSASKPGDPFEQPDLSVLDINVTGALWTVSLAIQQFRRQEKTAHGFRGKIGIIASVCGIYCCPTIPVYTASKHAVTGFVRSYGKYLPEESITLNAVNPNVIRTNISVAEFYDRLEQKGLLTPAEGVVDAFEELLGGNPVSGECFEIGPNYAKGQGIVKPKFADFVDEESKTVFDEIYIRSRGLLLP